MTSLRAELIAKHPDEALVSNLKALAKEVIYSIDHDQDCTALLKRIMDLSGLDNLDEEYFSSLYSHSSV